MSGRCPICGRKWSVEERDDGTYWCEVCKAPLELVVVEGGCILREIDG